MRYFCFCFALFSLFTYADTIYFKRGTIHSEVTIKSESYKEVVYKRGEAELKVSSFSIRDIEYSDTPPAFTDGKNAIKKGHYEEAIRWLGEALDDKAVVGKWLNEYANYNIGFAYHRWADNIDDGDKYEQAVNYYKKVLNKNAHSRFLYNCLLFMGECYIRLEEHDLAEKQFQKLKKLLKEGEERPLWLFQVELWEGHLAFEKNDYETALVKYKKAEKITKEKKLINLRNDTITAITNCYIANKDFSGAEVYLKGILRSANRDSYELVVCAKLGQALLFLKQNKVFTARRIAVEIILRYPQVSIQQANALYLVGQCYEKLIGKEKGAKKRAKTYYQMLKLAHPKSKWAVKGSQRLYKLR